MNSHSHILIIGGGIAGLAAAHALNGRVADGAIGAVTLLEAAPRLGGKIHTEQVDEFLIEAGPDALLALKPHGVALCREVGLGDRLIHTLEPRRAYVLHRSRLHPVPDGFPAPIPQRLWSLFQSRLFSPLEKVRFLLEPLTPPNLNHVDESLGSFVRRRLGQAAVDRLAAPLLAGIYAGDVDGLSVRATFPQLVELEQRYGSLTRAMRAPRLMPASGGGTDPAFVTLVAGLKELVDRVVERLDQVTIRTGTPASALEPGQDGRFIITLDSGERLASDGIVLAVPATTAAVLLRSVNPAAAAFAGSIPYVSTAVVALGFRRQDVAHPLSGHGYVVARGEGVLHTACTWVSSKWPYRAPPGHVLLRCYVGRAGDQVALMMDDDSLVGTILRELRPLLGISASPTLIRVLRWKEALPQYLVGHLDKMAALERALEHTPGIVLAGAGYRGVGIPDCIRQGIEAARGILALFGRGHATWSSGLTRTSPE